MLALAYLLCVLAPGAAFALGDGRLAAHCLFEGLPIAGAVHARDADLGLIQPTQVLHEHVGHHDHARHAQSNETPGAKTNQSSPVPADHHAVPGAQCCGMLCVSALPVVVADVTTPHPPVTFCPTESSRNVAGNPPSRHYRPPIS